MLDIDIKFTQKTSVLEVKFKIKAEGIIAIFGRSGSGKTTLLNILSGLIKPDYGHIILKGKELFSKNKNIFIPANKRNIGYVFQDSKLFPHYNIEKNLCYGQPRKNKGYFLEIVDLLGLDGLLNRYPNTLSGGEKQRVAIGRALLCEPKLLLMDEPLSSLDIIRKRELFPYLEKLSKNIKIPIIYVTHGLDEILRLADSMIMLNDSKVVSYGKVDELWGSESMRPWLPLKERSSLIKANFIKIHEKYPLSLVSIGDGVNLWINKVGMAKAFRLRIFANDITLALEANQKTSCRNIIPATIKNIINDNSSAEIELEFEHKNPNTIWANITQWAKDELELEVGKVVYLHIKAISIDKFF